MPTVTLPPAVSHLYLGDVPLASIYLGGVEIAAVDVAADIAFPSAIFDVWGQGWDPYGPAQRQTAASITDTSGTVAGVGDPVAFIPYFGENTDLGGTNRTPNLFTTSTGARPVLREQAGRRCWQFDGTNDALATTWVHDFGLRPEFATFGMVHVDASTGGCPWTFARGENSNSYFEAAMVANSLGSFDPNVRLGSTTFVDGDVADDYGALTPAGWRLIWCEYEFTSFSTDGGHILIELDDSIVVNRLITPLRSATTDISVATRAQVGARRNSTSSTNFFNSYLGRFGCLGRIPTSGEKATIKEWLRGTSYVP